MRTVAQVLDELGGIEYERIELNRIELELETELDELERELGEEAFMAEYEAYYS